MLLSSPPSDFSDTVHSSDLTIVQLLLMQPGLAPPPKAAVTFWVSVNLNKIQLPIHGSLMGVDSSSSGLDYRLLTCKTNALSFLMTYELASEKSLTRYKN